MDKNTLPLVIFSVTAAIAVFFCQLVAAEDIAPERIQAWAAQLQSPDLTVRRRIVTVLKQAGPAAGIAVPALSAALSDPDMDVRMGASQALARIGSVASPAVPALINALDDKQSCLRESAAIALGRIGSGARQAAPKLQLLSSSDSDVLVRRLASDALQKIQQP
jgi:HEAT repeat protein